MVVPTLNALPIDSALRSWDFICLIASISSPVQPGGRPVRFPSTLARSRQTNAHRPSASQGSLSPVALGQAARQASISDSIQRTARAPIFSG